MNDKIAIFIFSINFINRLLLSFLVLTKVITLSGVHCSKLAEQSYSNVEDYCRVQFYSAIDFALACLNDYFDYSYLNEYNKLSKMLISDIFDRDAIKEYPELCDSALDIELQMYVRHYKRPCLAEHLKIFREMESNLHVSCN